MFQSMAQYVIPVYQRRYSWGDRQCEKLWNDMYDVYKKGKRNHFIGSIVTVAETVSAMGLNKYLIIDGQQRMTTLSLLMIAMRDILKENGFQNEVITRNMLKGDIGTGESFYKMQLTEPDREVYERLVEGSSVDESVESKIYDNYCFFKEKITEFKDRFSISEIDYTLQKLMIVNITLDTQQGDDPQLIFESLNSTGMDLSKADLIRNYVLMGQSSEEQNRIYKDSWRPLEACFENQDSERIDRFFRDYLTMKNRNIVNFNNIYEEWKLFAQKSAEFNTPYELAADVLKFGRLYSNIATGQNELPEADIILQPFFEEIRELQMEVSYPLLMKLYADYKDGLIVQNTFVEVMRICISYILRRNVCDLPSNALNKPFASMVSQIDPNDYLNSLKAQFYYADGRSRFPRDDEFREQMISRNMYKMRRCHYFLVKIENHQNKQSIIPSQYSIEHIMPQTKNLNKEWQENLGPDYIEVQERCLHTLGNLTLTGYNSELGDRSFAEKKKFYEKACMCHLNSDVVSQELWNEKAMEARARHLADIACKVWTFPDIDDDVKMKYGKAKESGEESREYTLDDYKFSALSLELYVAFHKRVCEVLPGISCEYRKLYIAYKRNTRLFDIVVLKNALRFTISVDIDELNDPHGMCHDVSNKGHWGVGDTEVRLRSMNDVDYVVGLVRQTAMLMER